MKKVFVMALAAVFAFALAGCVTTVKEEKPTMSASEQSVSPSSSSSSSSSSSQSVNWTKASTAAEAAKGAGIDLFGVMEEIDLDDIKFTDPTFAYAGGVAQAVYESPATQLTVRKAGSSHTAPLSDRDKAEFSQTWTKSESGIDVTCYGPAHGAATVITWADGGQEYGVTWQGLGGDEMSMDSDEVAAIVKGIKDANTTSSSSGTDNYLTQSQVEDIIFQQGLGGFVSAQLIQGNDGVWYWQTITTDTENKQHTWLIDPSGNVISADSADSADSAQSQSQSSSLLTEDDIRNIVFEQGLGAFVSATPYQGSDGQWYWNLATNDVNNETRYFIVDPYGNVSSAG